VTGQQLTGGGDDRLRIQPLRPRAEHAQRDRRRRLQREPQRRVVGSAEEMQRRAHERRAHDLPRGERVEQRVRLEARDPRPEADERVLGLLRLHSADALDRGRRRKLARRALEQHLARERRAVQRARAEQRRRHRQRSSSASMSISSASCHCMSAPRS
jgi:hypothetical protein